jgi:hypothetical protein
LYFFAVLPVPEGEPDAPVDAIIHELTDEDPCQQRWLGNGSPDSIERFGFTRPGTAARTLTHELNQGSSGSLRPAGAASSMAELWTFNP